MFVYCIICGDCVVDNIDVTLSVCDAIYPDFCKKKREQ